MEMRQIWVDFDVYKSIGQLMTSWKDTPNDALRRLFKLGDSKKEEAANVPQTVGFYASRTFIPSGLRLRKILKGITHEAVTVEDGIRFKSELYQTPSAAAGAAAGTNVNGWFFWDYLDEATGNWRSLDALRKKTKLRQLELTEEEARELADL